MICGLFKGSVPGLHGVWVEPNKYSYQCEVDLCGLTLATASGNLGAMRFAAHLNKE
jgi:hypothetical protein